MRPSSCMRFRLADFAVPRGAVKARLHVIYGPPLQVPSFSNEVAMEIIAEDLGPVSSVFSEISESPVAAASLGQVCLSAEGATIFHRKNSAIFSCALSSSVGGFNLFSPHDMPLLDQFPLGYQVVRLHDGWAAFENVNNSCWVKRCPRRPFQGIS